MEMVEFTQRALSAVVVVQVTIQLMINGSGRGGHGRCCGSGQHRGHGGQQGCGQDGQQFQGQEDGLKGFIYDLQTDKSSDQFIQTTQEVANYVGHTHKKHTAVFVQPVEGLELDMPTEPVDPPAGDVIAWNVGRSSSSDTTSNWRIIRTSSPTYITSSCNNAKLLWKIESSDMWTMQQQARMRCSYYKSSNSLLDDDDHDTQMEASERDQEASEREQNNDEASEREQNNEDVCGVSVSARDQNNENICDASEAHD